MYHCYKVYNEGTNFYSLFHLCIANINHFIIILIPGLDWYNATMQRIFFIILMMLLIAGCGLQVQPTTETPGITLEGTLRPYPSDTPTLTPLPTGYISPTPSPTITPTLTPVYYTVRDNDDMFGIALRYGISLEALKTANPTVLPNWMGVGTVLLIPITPQAAISPSPTLMLSPTATPLYSDLHEPVCYPDGTGGLTCFVLVENNTAEALENVGGVLTLTDTQSGESVRQSGIMLLNLLQAGTAQPILVNLEGPIPADYSVSFAVDVLFPVPENDTRYLKLVLSGQTITYSQDKRSASVAGSLQADDDERGADLVWVLAVAYDSEDRVVGVRRWEAEENLRPGSQLDFSVNIYSLGGLIERVELLTEARALTP